MHIIKCEHRGDILADVVRVVLGAAQFLVAVGSQVLHVVLRARVFELALLLEGGLVLFQAVLLVASIE